MKNELLLYLDPLSRKRR